MNMKPKMLYFRRAAFVLLLLTGLTPVLQAQTQSQLSSPFTLKNALEFALEHKSNVKKAKLDEENSGHKIAEVRSRALPTVTGSGSLTYNPILQLSAVPGDLAGQPGTTLLIPFGQKWNSSGRHRLAAKPLRSECIHRAESSKNNTGVLQDPLHAHRRANHRTGGQQLLPGAGSNARNWW